MAAISPAASATYGLIKEYSGSTFFNDWTFYGNFDNLTEGDAIFVTEQVATSAQLAYVDPTTNHAIMKVDNTTMVPFNDKRNTVRISTNDFYGIGSLWIADMYHVPYGCSVWPAWWSTTDQQTFVWPAGGEIDTFEGINLVTNNEYTLHSTAGCTQEDPTQTSTLVNSTDCNADNGNEGCSVTDPSTSSYGSGFSAANGGVFVTEFAATGISIWFFDRSAVPSSLSANSSTISTSDLGTPTANWPNTGCSISEFFAPQQLIFDITLCGQQAGNATLFNETCTGVCYNDYVIGDPSVYDNAYFEVASVRVYSVNGTNTSSSTAVPTNMSTSGTSSSASTGTGSASTSPTSGSLRTVHPWTTSAVFMMLALAVFVSCS